jgi:hypothetical protein
MLQLCLGVGAYLSEGIRGVMVGRDEIGRHFVLSAEFDKVGNPSILCTDGTTHFEQMIHAFNRLHS